MTRKNKYKNSNTTIIQKQYHFNTPILFVDFEYITTRFKHNGYREYLQEIIEIGVIYMLKEDTVTYSQIVKPNFYLSHMNTTHTTSKFELTELVEGVAFEEAISKLKEYYVPGFTKVVSWGGSDLHNLNLLCQNNSIDFFISRTDYIDLSQKFRRFYNLTQSVKLEKALSLIHIDTHYDKHRALPDTEVLVKIFNHMLNDGFDKDNLLFKRREFS